MFWWFLVILRVSTLKILSHCGLCPTAARTRRCFKNRLKGLNPRFMLLLSKVSVGSNVFRCFRFPGHFPCTISSVQCPPRLSLVVPVQRSGRVILRAPRLQATASLSPRLPGIHRKLSCLIPPGPKRQLPERHSPKFAPDSKFYLDVTQ